MDQTSFLSNIPYTLHPFHVSLVISSGAESGAYYHPHFQRGKIDLIKFIGTDFQRSRMDPSPEGQSLDDSWSTRFGSVMPSSSASMAIPRVAHQEVFANFPYSGLSLSGGGGAADLYDVFSRRMSPASMTAAAAGHTAFDRIYREHQQAAAMMMHTNFTGRRRGTFTRADDIPSDHRSNRR